MTKLSYGLDSGGIFNLYTYHKRLLRQILDQYNVDQLQTVVAVRFQHLVLKIVLALLLSMTYFHLFSFRSTFEKKGAIGSLCYINSNNPEINENKTKKNVVLL